MKKLLLMGAALVFGSTQFLNSQVSFEKLQGFIAHAKACCTAYKSQEDVFSVAKKAESAAARNYPILQDDFVGDEFLGDPKFTLLKPLSGHIGAIARLILIAKANFDSLSQGVVDDATRKRQAEVVCLLVHYYRAEALLMVSALESIFNSLNDVDLEQGELSDTIVKYIVLSKIFTEKGLEFVDLLLPTLAPDLRANLTAQISVNRGLGITTLRQGVCADMFDQRLFVPVEPAEQESSF